MTSRVTSRRDVTKNQVFIVFRPKRTFLILDVRTEDLAIFAWEIFLEAMEKNVNAGKRLVIPESVDVGVRKDPLLYIGSLFFPPPEYFLVLQLSIRLISLLFLGEDAR